MRNRLLIFTVLLFLSSLALGKGVSEYVPLPEIDYILNGIVITGAGVPKIALPVSLEATNNDSSYVTPVFSYYERTVSFTDDSGKCHFALKNMNTYQTGIRFVVISGPDTIRSPWRFIFTAKKQETFGTFSSHDCNSHTTVAPTNETYTFDTQTIVLP